MLKAITRISVYGVAGGLSGFTLFMYAWPMRLVVQFVRPDWEGSYSPVWFLPSLVSLVVFSSMAYTIAHLESNYRHIFLNESLLALGVFNAGIQAFFYISIEPNWLSPGASVIVPIAAMIFSVVAICLMIEIYKGYSGAKCSREK